jgi:vacuolar-type H+-ATPase subunit H
MSTPRRVAEAEETANRLHEELLKAQQTPEEPAPQQVAEQTPETTPVQPQEDEAASTDPKPSGSQDDPYEHRFKVLQGKYNSEVPRLAAENKELKSTLQQIHEELELLKAKPAEPLVRPEEIEEYGEGLIDVARRIAREELASKETEIKSLKQKLDALADVTTRNVQKDFIAELTEKVPDWSQMNENQAFLAWLDEVDDLTGRPRQQLLTEAERARDAARAAKFFLAFKKTSNRQATESAFALDSQVVPDATKTPQSPPAKKVWSRGEIAEFYNRLRRGQVSDKEAVAIEADIQAATIEGRIR